MTRGALDPLLRERRPLAALAMLALLLPMLLSAAGLHTPIATTRLADGTVVICTHDGFVRVAADDPAAQPDDLPCCTACTPAGPGFALTGAVPAADVPRAFARLPVPAAPAGTLEDASRERPGAIRAPPGLSA